MIYAAIIENLLLFTIKTYTLIKNKSICFLLPGWATKHTGGAELQCYMLSEELIKRGWNVEVITDEKDSYIYKNNKYYNAQINYFYLKRTNSKLLTYFTILYLLFKSTSSYYYVRTDARIMRGALSLFCKINHKKMIYALAHDDDAKNISFLKRLKSKKKNGLKKILHLCDSYLADRLTDNSIYNADIIICQSKQQREILKKHTGLKSDIMRNSIPYDLFRRAAGRISDKEDVVLWVANMRSFKRPELFVKLAKELKVDGWKFVMIGKAYEYIEVIKKVDNNNFQYWGELSYEETNKWFEKAKILVNTSLSEGFSNTFIQAWHFKTLILSLSVDPDNLLSQKKYGIYAKGNFTQLKQEIISVANNYDDYHAMLDQAYAFASKEFELRRNANKLESLLLCGINSNKKGKLEN